MGIGAVVLRNDIQYQRYDLVSPRELNRVFAQIPGLGRPTVFGVRVAVVGREAAAARVARGRRDRSRRARPTNRSSIRSSCTRSTDPTPIVRAESAQRTLMIAGDGEGMVDAAERRPARRRGRDAVQRVVPDRRPRCARAVAPDATLVVTDENRSRARIWSSVLDNVGYTEQAGEKPLVDDPNDARLPLFPGERRRRATPPRSSAASRRSRRARTATRSPTRPKTAPRARIDGDLDHRVARGRARQRGRPVHPAPAAMRRSPPIT